jgi:hypothetical protein
MLGMYAHRMKHLGQLLKAPLLIVFVAYIGLICGSLLATWKYGILTSYIGFAPHGLPFEALLYFYIFEAK